jgi:hypothetical protein
MITSPLCKIECILPFLLCRYGEILDDIQSNPEKHGGPPDCIVSTSAFLH